MSKLRKKMQRQDCIHRDTCTVKIDCKLCDGKIETAKKIREDYEKKETLLQSDFGAEIARAEMNKKAIEDSQYGVENVIKDY